MDLIIGKNKKKYINTIAENYLCVPAVLETILESENIHSLNMYSIADYFGVVLPCNITYPMINNVSHSSKSKELGITLKYDSINTFFADFNIPLCEQYIGINMIHRDFFVDYVSDILSSGKHIICGFEYHSLYNTIGEYTGHVSIIVDADVSKETINILDPGPKEPGQKTILAESLYRAVSFAKDGLWVISRK